MNQKKQIILFKVNYKAAKFQKMSVAAKGYWEFKDLNLNGVAPEEVPHYEPPFLDLHVYGTVTIVLAPEFLNPGATKI